MASSANTIRLLEAPDVPSVAALLARAMGYDPAPGRHWHVHMMAVEPRLHSKGHGGLLLREVLAATSGRTDYPTVLTTHTEKNVRFYQRFGFDVAEKRTATPGPKAYDIWCMRREGAA